MKDEVFESFNNGILRLPNIQKAFFNIPCQGIRPLREWS